MSPRLPNSFRVLQLVCAFLLLHHSNWQASMVSGTGHLQSTTRVLQHKSGLLGDDVTMCDRILNTNYPTNLTECRTKASKLFPGYDQLSECKRDYSEFLCQIEIACQHCDEQLQDWLTNTQTDMNYVIKGSCKDSAGQFSPFMCPITVAPTTNLTTTTTSTTHNSTTRAQFPKWAIYTLASGVIIVIVLVLLILLYGLTRFHHHDSSHHHESDSKQSFKSTRTHKSSSSRGSGSQANHQHTAKSLKWYPQNRAIKKATKATPTLKKASSGKVASRGKVTTSSPRRLEGKQKHHIPLGPKMVNPRAHSTGNVKKGH